MVNNLIWYLTLFSMLLVCIVFIYIVLNASKKTEDYLVIQKKGYQLRKYFFACLLVLLLIGSSRTLINLPYDKPSTQAAQSTVIKVDAIQFGWKISQKTVKVGEPIEFQVSSSDVNHGMGIYNEEMILLAQTQAMPNNKNTVYYTFQEPGTYKILCLEYCGVAHHLMVGTIEVLP